MTEEAIKARREYAKKYREQNRSRINAKHKEWRNRNPDKVKANNVRYREWIAEKQKGG